MGIIAKLKLKRSKNDILKVIYRSELASKKMGIASVELIENYAQALIENKRVYFQLKKITKSLKSGNFKDVVYKDIMDRDIITLLRESRIKQIPSEAIFKDYVPLKRIGERTLSSISKKLYVPFVIYGMLVLGLNSTMKSFLGVAEYGVVSFGSVQLWMMENFVLINLSIGLLFAFFLLVIPTKTPIIKKVFIKIKGMLALSTIRTMSEMSYTSGDMYNTIVKQFDVKIKSKKTLRNVDNIGKLIVLMKDEKMIDLMEGAELKLGAERGDFSESVDILLEEKRIEVESLQEMVNSIIGTLSMLLLTPPVFMIVSVLTTLMANTGG